MLWPSRILTICTLCWCALCFVSLSLLWQLQRFGLMLGCFTKFYLPLLTMNWTTDFFWHCFTYQLCRFLLEEQWPHLTMLLKFFLSLCQLLWIGNWIEHLKVFSLLTHLSDAISLNVGAHTTPLMKACVVHRTLENLRGFFSVSSHKMPWLILFCDTSVSIW